MLLVTFCLRYIDIFLYFISLYNLLMKIFYIFATLFIIYLIRMKSPYCDKYKSSRDDFKHYYIIYPAALIMTLFIHTRSELIDFLWCYSLWLESVAFIPQINIFRTISNDIDHTISLCVACLGIYRFFYLLSWACRFYFNHHIFFTQVLAGLLQTFLSGLL